jgi:hypothetical protein
MVSASEVVMVSDKEVERNRVCGRADALGCFPPASRNSTIHVESAPFTSRGFVSCSLNLLLYRSKDALQ